MFWAPSPIHAKKTLTSEIFGFWPQYFYTVTIHTFITQSFMNSEGLLHCTQTSFNLFSWSNTLKELREFVQPRLVGWPFVLPFLRSLWHVPLWSVDVFCNLGECTLIWMCSLGVSKSLDTLGLAEILWWEDLRIACSLVEVIRSVSPGKWHHLHLWAFPFCFLPFQSTHQPLYKGNIMPAD